MIVNAVKAAIVTTLAGDATLTGMLAAGTAGIYDAPAPQGANPPYIVFQRLSGVPAYTLAQRAWDDQTYLVKAITSGPSKRTGGSIAERIDTVLTDSAPTVTGGTVLYFRRETDVEYPETVSGLQHHHTGATYRVWTT